MKNSYQLEKSEEQQLNSYFQLTADGSYSLKLQSEHCESEFMHSDQGAFSETIYVYLPVVKFVFENQLNPLFLSIGLGLGYIEIMTVAYYLEKKTFCLNDELFFIFSYEKEKKLIQLFKNYFLNNEIPDSFKMCYDSIINLNAKFFSIDKELLKKTMRNLIIENKIKFYNNFSIKSFNEMPVHGIYFDAFSAKSSPDLWQSDVLNHIFHNKNCARQAVFATYASRTNLKKLLKENHFFIHKKKGFSGKRECLLAERNSLK
ncbi:MnmC family methyltransferase [Silvanigrella aquatica]|uniref:MnmC-like methyltransferase domain-containing protein n=1 Tax=Silvanigrella aquatica TaxID=1915309 RepID=A0A1L4D2K0_9BACT|nr:MnmC family methyltransferase [Silvanigrella aquatica]APJ04435.1 hypothetical protein AXG55_11160 [Silvanigrella aquatica]